MRLPEPAVLAELTRLPAALSVPGDAWSGAAATDPGQPGQPRVWAMPVASVLLYWAGMALNDWADRELDAVERPERPIPSGRIDENQALGVALGLGAAGVGVAGLVGGRSALRIALPLSAMIALYDVVAKESKAGPVVMASTRVLDVLLGAHDRPAAACAPAAAAGAHTLGLTALSRGEVHGSSSATATAVLAETVGVATGTALAALRDRSLRRRDRLATVALAGAYATVVGRAQAAAAKDPSAGTVRRATGIGIGGFSYLQSAWLARRGRLGLAALVVGAGPALKQLSRRVSAT